MTGVNSVRVCEWEISFWRLAWLGTGTVLGLQLCHFCQVSLKSVLKNIIFEYFDPYYDVIDGVYSSQNTSKCVFVYSQYMCQVLLKLGGKLSI